MARLYKRSICAFVQFTWVGLSCTPQSEPIHDWGELPPYIQPKASQIELRQREVELGRVLFFSPLLSANGQISCGSCHPSETALQDGQATSLGVTGIALARNTPSLFNIGWSDYITWSNVAFFDLEQHMMVPLFGDAPPEMSAQFDAPWLVDRLRQSEEIMDRLNDEGLDLNIETMTWARVIDLIAKFMRSLSSFDSPWDRAQMGDPTAMSESAKIGQTLFFSKRLGCATCHAPPFFSLAFRSPDAPRAGTDIAFANTGLYYVPSSPSGYPDNDPGLMEFTGKSEDGGRFRIPSLRNVELTGPYMHDGSVPDLQRVIDHYESGGRTIVDGPNQGVGANHPNRDTRLARFKLSAKEREALIAFLHSLTGASARALPARL